MGRFLISREERMPGWQYHHALPQQCYKDRRTRTFVAELAKMGISIADKRLNRVALPSNPATGAASGLIVHCGAHPLYNQYVIEKLIECADSTCTLPPFARILSTVERVSGLQAELMSLFSRRATRERQTLNVEAPVGGFVVPSQAVVDEAPPPFVAITKGCWWLH